MEAHTGPRLVLRSDEQTVQLNQVDASQGARLTLGASEENALVVQGEHTSRHHAWIEVHRNAYYLVDTSTNGTFVQTEDQRVSYVHRGRVRLWGAGWIALGEPLHVRRPIAFSEELVA